MPIFIVDEDGAPVNASVRNVQRNSGEIQSWPARHSASSVSTRSMEASIPRALSDESPRKRLGLNCLISSRFAIVVSRAGVGDR